PTRRPPPAWTLFPYTTLFRSNLFKARFSNAGIICETHLLQGSPEKQILKLADSVNADLIILGLINHSTLYKVFVGSVSNEVIKGDRKSTRLNSSHVKISYAVF